jgi:SAM-dependent methyltransferase
MDPELLRVCRCPRCGGTIEANARCGSCGIAFSEIGGVVCLFADPERVIARWRGQIARYESLAAEGVRAIDEQLGQFALMASTRLRLERLRAATSQNAETVVELFRSAGLDPAPSESGDFTLVEYYDHILRDWADLAERRENESAFELVSSECPDRLGRVAVLGAGAGRLAYDLAISGRADVTIALDRDPLLVLAARRIVFGGGLRLFEFPVMPVDAASVCVEHELTAKPAANLVFVLADAFDDSLAAGAFDTVVTPWFIDVAGDDLARTIGVIHRLVAPGGRWINLGPLSHPSDRPASRRYTEGELCELVRLAGFELGTIRKVWLDLLRSRASGRARSELALLFAAKKTDAAVVDSDVPRWLVLSHIAIPRFSGLDGYRPEHGVLAYIARQIDGKTTLADIASRMVKEHGARPDAALDGTRALLSIVYQACRTSTSNE